MTVLTVRVSEKEKARLARRAKAAGVSSGALVRQLINQRPLETAADLLAEIEQFMGDPRLKVKARK